MPAFLVTGNPGSGKSAVAAELSRRGFVAIDPDYDPGLSHWLDAEGRRVGRDSTPDEEWFRSHRWVWNRDRLTQLLAPSDRVVFVCGISRNLDELLDVFTQVFLLRIDDRTQEERLVAHDRARPPGRSEAGRQEIREGRPVFEAEMLQLGAAPLDGTMPTSAVVDQILVRISAFSGGTGDASAC